MATRAHISRISQRLLRLVLLVIVGSQFANAGIVPEYKVTAIEKVFGNLVAAAADESSPPHLEVNDSTGGEMAQYIPGTRTILIQERLYDICAGFGPDSLNALATVLGHELAHYYRRHGAGDAPGTRKAEKYLRRITHSDASPLEAEADLFGGIYCAVAGYDALEVMSQVLDKFYTLYPVNANERRDLSPSSRKAIAWNALDSLKKLVPVFFAATYQTLIRNYREAEICYDYVIKTFPSRELLNNSGVVYALDALRMMDNDDVNFIYPLELDADTQLRALEIYEGRIERGTRSPTHVDSLRIRGLLDTAESRFMLARKKDKQYAPALINLANVYLLKQDYKPAIDSANAAMRLDTTRATRILATVVVSIALAREGHGAEARAKLESLRVPADPNEPFDIVHANLAVLDSSSLRSPYIPGHGSSEERLQGLPADDSLLLANPEIKVLIGGSEKIQIGARQIIDCQAIRVQNGTSWAQFLYTRDMCVQSTARHIVLGSTTSEVLQRYGPTPWMVNAMQGTYYIYPAQEIIFLIDSGGFVRKWIDFATS